MLVGISKMNDKGETRQDGLSLTFLYLIVFVPLKFVPWNLNPEVRMSGVGPPLREWNPCLTKGLEEAVLSALPTSSSLRSRACPFYALVSREDTADGHRPWRAGPLPDTRYSGTCIWTSQSLNL